MENSISVLAAISITLLFRGNEYKAINSFLLDVSNNTCSVKKASDILKLVKEDGQAMKEYQEMRNF